MEEELNGLKLHGGQVGQLSWWGLSPRAPYASRPWEREAAAGCRCSHRNGNGVPVGVARPYSTRSPRDSATAPRSVPARHACLGLRSHTAARRHETGGGARGGDDDPELEEWTRIQEWTRIRCGRSRCPVRPPLLFVG